MSSAKSIVKELVRLSMSGPVPDPLTYHRLQTLLYYAQAWSLVLRDSELFPDEIECLEEGPAVAAVVGTRGDGPDCQVVRPTAFDPEPNLDDEDEALFLRYLWAAYGFLSPTGLWASIQNEAPFLKAKQARDIGGEVLIGMNELAESFRGQTGMPAPLDVYGRLRREREKEAEVAIQNSPPLDVEAIWKGSRSVTPSACKR
jgi:uncharacterized phage-associated protein